MRDITPSQAAYALTVSPEDFRNWRRRGHLDGWGERVGRATLYDVQEVRLIGVAHFIARCGIGLEGGFALVRERPYLGADTPGAFFVTLTLDPDIGGLVRSVTPCRISQIKREPDDTDEDEPIARTEVNVGQLHRRIDDRLRVAREHITESE